MIKTGIIILIITDLDLQTINNFWLIQIEIKSKATLNSKQTLIKNKIKASHIETAIKCRQKSLFKTF